jgi:hypothetical protein
MGRLEDSKLKDAVESHGGKNWGAIAGRANVLDLKIDRAILGVGVNGQKMSYPPL